MSVGVLAISMAAVFSYWVWSLKQELSHSQGHLDTTAHGSTSTHVEPHTTTRVVHQPSPKKRRSDGVPVWTIE